jgi:NAD(P)-dependent dehydrogenase (short-subunit alcohol dehydrogenase family)
MTDLKLNELLEDKTAVVTGGANGIGSAVVRAFTAAGVKRGVVLDLEGELRGSSPAGWTEVAVDLRDDQDMTRAFGTVIEVLGGVDLVVASAGVVPRWSGLKNLDFDQHWDPVFRVNVRSVAFMLQCLMPGLHEGASVVVVASMDSWRGNRTIPGYSASKHAVLGLVRSAAHDLGARGIRVNAVAPGPIATKAHLDRMRWREGEFGISVDQALTDAKRGTALGRMATEEEVASAVLFLASPMSAGIAGHLLPVDAGLV